jgi:plasmid stability protein
MTKKKNRHIGSTFDSWLDEVGLRKEVTVAAIKSVIAQQLADEMKKKKKLTKKRMAELLKIRQALADEVGPSFETLAADLRKLTRRRKQTPSEILLREERKQR